LYEGKLQAGPDLKICVLELWPGSNLAQRRLSHHAQYLEKNISCGHRGQFSINIVGWGNFDNICRHDVETIETSQNGTKFPSRPATCLWRSSRRSEGWVDGINVNGEVNRVVSYSVSNFFDDSISSDRVDFACLDSLKARSVVIFIVFKTRKGCPNGAVLRKNKLGSKSQRKQRKTRGHAKPNGTTGHLQLMIHFESSPPGLPSRSKCRG